MANTYPALEVSFAPGIASSAVPGALDWVDITSYVLNADEKVGSEDEFSEPGAGSLDLELDNSRGRFDPDAAYDATDRPYAGDLLPLTWFRWRGGDSSVDTDVFYGQVSIEGFRLGASQFSGQMVVQVTVLDMLEQLANTDLPESVWALTVESLGPLTWWRLGESSGNVMVDSSGNEHHGEHAGGATFNSRAGLIDGSSDNAILFSGVDRSHLNLSSKPTAAITAYPFTVSFWTDADAVTGGPTTGPTLWSQAGGAGFMNVENLGTAGSVLGASDNSVAVLLNDGTNRRNWFTPNFAFDGQVHNITVRVESADIVNVQVDGEATTTSLYANVGSAPAVQGVGGVMYVGHGNTTGETTLDEVLIFDYDIGHAAGQSLYAAGASPWAGELTSDRAAHLLDAVDFPASLRTIDTGQSTMPAASLATDALSALQETVKAEGGDLYVDHHDGGKLRMRDRHAKWTDTRSVTSQATFGDGSGEVTYSGVDIQDDRIINYAAVQRANGATMVAQDAASMTQYQRRTLSESGLLIETDTEAQHRANLIVAEKKDRHRRVRSVTLEPAGSAHPAWAQVFAREIGDRVTVKWRPPYGGTYTFDSWIIGISHSWRPADDKPWRTTFYLEPVPYGATAEPYFIVGTSTVGGDARIGY